MLDGKVAIVTRAGSGIGKSIALAYAKNGAKIVAADIHKENGQSIAEQIKEAGSEAVL